MSILVPEVPRTIPEVKNSLKYMYVVCHVFGSRFYIIIEIIYKIIKRKNKKIKNKK